MYNLVINKETLIGRTEPPMYIIFFLLNVHIFRVSYSTVTCSLQFIEKKLFM